jgi:MazG family protein
VEFQQDHLERLSKLVARLRGPDGCPWDREQTLADVRAYLLEEAHEVAGAIDEEDPEELRVELGDLLFQLVFAICLAEEEGTFSLAQVVEGAEAKMIARHPHVFGEEKLADSVAVRMAWERRKLDSGDPGRSLLAGVPASLPALLAAYRIGQKTAGVGFDWPGAEEVMAKLEEELEELRSELVAGDDNIEAVSDELGDLLFTLANLARHLGVDPEASLAHANRKFRRRFGAMEGIFQDQGRSIGKATLEELEAAWQQAKRLVG